MYPALSDVSAYRSAEIETMLKEKGLTSRIHYKGHRIKPLSKRQEQGNKTRSKTRVRVEHIFEAQSNDMGGILVRSIGIIRAKAHIEIKNPAYNMRRWDAKKQMILGKNTSHRA